MSKLKVPIHGPEQLELVDRPLSSDADGSVSTTVDSKMESATPKTESKETEPISTDPRDIQIRTLTAERDTVIDRMARLQAEFENSRKRTEREKNDFRDFAVSDAVMQLIPVLDNFDLALRNAATSSTDELRKGVELIRKQLESNLERLGVVTIDPHGQLFDPHLHEAIEAVDTKDAPDHTVLSVLQRGYKLKERLLRPAMVRVARNPGRAK